MLTFLAINPFTGDNAPYGQSLIAGCYPAVKLINQAGGILGDTIQCKPVDTRGDPVDAVPALHAALSTTNDVVGSIGPDDEAVLGPIVSRAHLPRFPSSGQDAFDHQTDPYFYRIHPTDHATSVAMALWAQKQGYTRAAAFFGTDVAAQGTVDNLSKAFTQVGGTIVVNKQVPEDQTSYSTEMSAIASAHPQVIFTEEDAQTGATAFRQFQQLNNGLIPIIGTDATLTPDWGKAVSAAVGDADFTKSYTGLEAYAPATGPAWQAFNDALLTSSAQVPDPQQWATSEFSMWPYDAANLMALAMIEAKSVDPTVYNSYILKVAQGGSGAVDVHTFKEGKAALSSGKTIHYLGATGAIHLDQYHNSQGDYEAANVISGNVTHVATIAGTDVGSVLDKITP
ncbi:MAG: ABC transporter substrate-binding protein [Candidatus Dormibacteraeota bacterium]|nr:ABC transporter substrate-binding protein [Candidatus Dormibacteraeota bacterium]